MRRRLMVLLAGLSVVAGSSVGLHQAQAAVLCPPCALAGVVAAAGGFPDPSSLSIYGQISVIATTYTGEVADVATVNTSYNLYVSGTVSEVDGMLSGTAFLHADRYVFPVYDSFGGTVTVSGTRSLLRLSSATIEANLVIDGDAISGTILRYG